MSRIATRHERVIIDLDDRFTSPMARMAASTSMFKHNLDDSRGSVVAFDKTTKDTAPTIDKLSGRLAIMGRTAAALGPSIVPVMAAAVPAVAALSTELVFTGAAAGTAVLAFKGLGDGLKAVNQYQLEPTQANFEKMQQALKNMGPAAREFIGFLDHIGPKLQTLRLAAQQGLLPGVESGIESLMTRLPQVRSIISEIATAAGDVAANFGADLASSRWNDFFEFLKTEARPTLIELGQVAGNVGHGIAELFVAFAPMSRDFTAGIVKASEAFDQWASKLSGTGSFQEFLAYVQETGPQVLKLFGSLANAVLQIVEAAAPMAGTVLTALTAVANIIAKIADSPLGTPLLAAVGAMSALSLASNTFSNIMESKVIGSVRTLRADFRTMGKEGIVAWARTEEGARRYAAASERVRTTLAGVAKTTAVVGGLALATSGLADKTGLAGTATGALVGMIAGPYGAAVGAGIGFAKDFAAANNDIEASLGNVDKALSSNSLDQYRSALSRLQADTRTLANDNSGFLGFTGNLKRVSAFLSGDNAKIARQAAYLKQSIHDTANETGGLASLFGSALGPSLGKTAHQFDLAALSADGFRGSLTQVNALLEKRGTFRAYQASLDAFTAGLKKNGKAASEFTDKGRENNTNLDAIASSALRFAEKLKGIDRINFLKRARAQIADAADAMNLPERKSRELLKMFDKLDGTNAKPKVNVQGADKAAGKVKNVKDKAVDLDKYTAHPKLLLRDLASGKISLAEAALARLNHQKATVTIETVHRTVNQVVGAGNRLVGSIFGPGSADGSTVPKTGLPYADRHPYLLADGEEVISNRHGQADKHRALLKAINAGRLADGGTAIATYASTRATFQRHENERELSAELRHLRDSLDKTRSTLQALRSSMESSLKHDPFGNGAAGLMTQLEADRNDSFHLGQAETRLRKKGISNALLQALAASGDVNTAQQLAAMSRGQIAQFSQAYAGRNAAVTFAENRAGAPQIATIHRLEREIRHLNRQLQHLRGIDKAVEKGARKGVGDRDRKTAQRRRSRR